MCGAVRGSQREFKTVLDTVRVREATRGKVRAREAVPGTRCTKPAGERMCAAGKVLEAASGKSATLRRRPAGSAPLPNPLPHSQEPRRGRGDQNPRRTQRAEGPGEAFTAPSGVPRGPLHRGDNDRPAVPATKRRGCGAWPEPLPHGPCPSDPCHRPPSFPNRGKSLRLLWVPEQRGLCFVSCPREGPLSAPVVFLGPGGQQRPPRARAVMLEEWLGSAGTEREVPFPCLWYGEGDGRQTLPPTTPRLQGPRHKRWRVLATHSAEAPVLSGPGRLSSNY